MVNVLTARKLSTNPHPRSTFFKAKERTAKLFTAKSSKLRPLHNSNFCQLKVFHVMKE